MNLSFLPEPDLEFGEGGHHIDIRFGLTRYGPLDLSSANRPQQIRVGIVGTPQNVEQVREWLDRCRKELPAKKSRQPNLFPPFGGFNDQATFRSSLVMNDGLCRTISARAFDDIVTAAHNAAITETVDLFVTEFDALAESRSVDVIVCAVPPQIVALRDPEDAVSPSANRYDFHHMVKARAMRTKIPIQLVLPDTYDPSARRRQKIKTTRTRTKQDEATTAWNFHTALYYKANGCPWRIVGDSQQLVTCFVGVSFYRSLDAETLHTSMAQVFNERGDGIIVRGDDPVRLSKTDMLPHLDEQAASKLLTHALDRYHAEHKHMPARVVVHKTSAFDDAEMTGFRAAARSKSVSHLDALSIGEGSPIRLFRLGAYPPLRGTLMTLDSANHLLYLRGSVDFFQTYPGQYIPRPIIFRSDYIEQTPTFLAKEILALSKMNWNDTQFDGGSPITIGAARKVSGILKYVGKNDPLAHRYSHYM